MVNHTVKSQNTPGSTTLSFKAQSVAVMDYAACHVVYVDKRAQEDRFVRKDGLASPSVMRSNDGDTDYFNANKDLGEPEEVQMNLQAILSVFNGGTFYDNVPESTPTSYLAIGQHHERGIRRSLLVE